MWTNQNYFRDELRIIENINRIITGLVFVKFSVENRWK